MWSPTFWKQQLRVPSRRSHTTHTHTALTLTTRTRSFPARTPRLGELSSSSDGPGTDLLQQWASHLSPHTPSPAHTNPVTVRCWDLQKLDGHSPSRRRRDQHSKNPFSIPPGHDTTYTHRHTDTDTDTHTLTLTHSRTYPLTHELLLLDRQPERQPDRQPDRQGFTGQDSRNKRTAQYRKIRTALAQPDSNSTRLELELGTRHDRGTGWQDRPIQPGIFFTSLLYSSLTLSGP